jgi:hypothetical protein
MRKNQVLRRKEGTNNSKDKDLEWTHIPLQWTHFPLHCAHCPILWARSLDWSSSEGFHQQLTWVHSSTAHWHMDANHFFFAFLKRLGGGLTP